MIRLFRRTKRVREISEAELTRRLIDPSYLSTVCGRDVDATHGVTRPASPFGWKNPPEPDPDDAFDLGGAEILTHSYARRDGENFVRAVLPIPVQGTDTQVLIDVWCSLKVGNHAMFRGAQTRGDADSLGELFSWLYTQLPPGTGPVLTEGMLLPQPGGATPLYRISNAKHPFFLAQTEGLTGPEIVELYEACGQTELVELIRS